MAMKVYPAVGEALEFAVVDNNKAVTTVVGGSAGLEEGYYGGAVEVVQDRSETKNGATRVLVKVQIKTPYGASQGTDPKGVAPMTLHVVLTVPRPLVESLIGEKSGWLSSQVTTVGNWLTALLVPLFTDKTVGQVQSCPILEAVTSGLPLDLNSGTYGQSE